MSHWQISWHKYQLSHTNEEDREGDEEQEDMGNQDKSVHEAAIVQHAICHTVSIGAVLAAAKGQGHATVQRSRRTWCHSGKAKHREITKHQKTANANCCNLFHKCFNSNLSVSLATLLLYLHILCHTYVV